MTWTYFGFLLFSAVFIGCKGTMLFISRMPLQALSSGIFCDNIPGLCSVQRSLCRQYPDIMVNIGQGLQLAADECKHQFRHHRWNCSIAYNPKETGRFSKFMNRGNREVAFIHTITSAGIAYSVARACSNGGLTDCACDPNLKSGTSRDSKGEFQWAGCGDNTNFGVKFARQFIETKSTVSRDAKGLMNTHNNSVGRRGVRKHVRLKCKCHGVSGACNMRTCWKAMENFAYIGDFLKKRYDRAVLVGMDQDATGLVTYNNNKKLKKTDIVYMELSPDYCNNDPSVGSLGTDNRLCNRTSSGPDACESMCCGRGYNTKTVLETVNCGCKFQWCCFVKCKSCSVIKDEHTCKETESNRM